MSIPEEDSFPLLVASPLDHQVLQQTITKHVRCAEFSQAQEILWEALLRSSETALIEAQQVWVSQQCGAYQRGWRRVQSLNKKRAISPGEWTRTASALVAIAPEAACLEATIHQLRQLKYLGGQVKRCLQAGKWQAAIDALRVFTAQHPQFQFAAQHTRVKRLAREYETQMHTTARLLQARSWEKALFMSCALQEQFPSSKPVQQLHARVTQQVQRAARWREEVLGAGAVLGGLIGVGGVLCLLLAALSFVLTNLLPVIGVVVFVVLVLRRL